MRVAILGSRGYPSTYGGFETFVRRLAPHLVAAGDEVIVYGRRTGVARREATVDGVRAVTTAGIDRKSISTLLAGLTSTVDAGRQRIDVALVLNCANGFFLPLLGRRGIPTAVNVDGLEWQRDKWGAVGKAVFRAGASQVARHADRIVVDSRAIGEVWEAEFGVRTTFLPYGADIVEPGPTEPVEELGLEPGGYLLVVARLVPENSIDLFLDAVHLLPPRIPVVIVGSANYRSPIEERIRLLAASRPEVLALGHVDDQALLGSLWAHCGAYFHGHTVGGTNPALLQAMGHGAPVVAVDTPFNREVVDSDDLLVPADAAAVATRLEAVLGDGGTRQRLRDHGRSVVTTRYSWTDVCDGYRSLLETLVELPVQAGG